MLNENGTEITISAPHVGDGMLRGLVEMKDHVTNTTNKTLAIRIHGPLKITLDLF